MDRQPAGFLIVIRLGGATAGDNGGDEHLTYAGRALRGFAGFSIRTALHNHFRCDGSALRLHYIDEGARDGATVLLLHGEPSWSFLYRKMIPPLTAAGHRVLAPDLIGFGRSDKPSAQSDYTFERHVAWMSEWIEQNDLRSITLFCQDWGGLIGLRLVARFPQRFVGVIAANTGLPAGGGQIPFAFKIWLAFSKLVPKLPVGWLISRGCVKGLTDAEKRAYDAPFPDERYKAGAGLFRRSCPSPMRMRQ